jgi:arabinose-5-phosphate isomerase
MKKKNFIPIAKEVIETELKSLRKLKSSINNSFNKAVEAIINCKNGKIIISGVGKSGIIGKKISSTFASVGIPSFFVDAAACSHGDLGQICSNDILILISFSGESAELKNIIQYVKRNKKITLIGIVSKKNSILYKSSNISLLIPNVLEAGPGNIVPSSSTVVQLSLGDALAIATMNYRKFGKLDFKKFHPSGSLGAKLKTVEDLMIKGNNIPFINENIFMKIALKIMNKFNNGVLIVRNKKKQTLGIISDGDIKRISEKNSNIKNLITKNIMKKNPISVDKNMLAAQALSIMNSKKVTCLCVHGKNNRKKTIGIITIHNILRANIQ